MTGKEKLLLDTVISERDTLSTRLAEVEKERDDLRTSAQAFVDKLAIMEKPMDAVFQIAHIHGCRYKGPNYGEELKALKALLE